MIRVSEDEILLGDDESGTATSAKEFEATVDIDPFGVPIGIEVLWIKDRIGEQCVQNLVSSLRSLGLKLSFDEEEDILTVGLGTGEVRSADQRDWVGEIRFAADNAFANLRLRAAGRGTTS